MAQIFLNCPHCQGTKVGMNILAKGVTKDGMGIAFAQCNNCTMPVSVLVRLISMVPQSWTSTNINVIDGGNEKIINVFPALIDTTAPDHVDPIIARIFVQAENARRRADHHIAGMGFRKTLDIALSTFDPSLKGDLYTRIDALAARHDITPAMQQWAHQIRLIGNEAAHEPDEPTQEDIDAMAGFSETLLKYLFTLPAEVKERTASPAS